GNAVVRPDFELGVGFRVGVHGGDDGEAMGCGVAVQAGGGRDDALGAGDVQGAGRGKKNELGNDIYEKGGHPFGYHCRRHAHERNLRIRETSSSTAIPSLRRYSWAGVSKKSSSLVQSTSASPMIAVCMTMISFTSRIGAVTRGFRVTRSAEHLRD